MLPQWLDNCWWETKQPSVGGKHRKIRLLRPTRWQGEADRQAATIKGHVAVYVNEGHDIENAAQMKEAIESNSGIPGVIVKYASMPDSSRDKAMIKWDGISTLNNFQFEPNGIRVWRAYKVGSGKLEPWSSLRHDASSFVELKILEPPVETNKQADLQDHQTMTGCQDREIGSDEFI